LPEIQPKKFNRIWVDKVWGKEEIVVNINQYCLKFLHLRRGYQCSLHHHKIKDETFYISKGSVLMEYAFPNDPEIKEKVMGVGDDIRIKPFMKHRFTGLEDSVIIEISTQHLDGDSYREPGQESRYVGHRLCFCDCPVAKKPNDIFNSVSEVK
jgi:mannose-6-phosphate isomerase-like protein (cupin superfamily)